MATLTLEEIQSQIAELEKARAEVLKTERKAKLKEVRSLVELFGFTADEVFAAPQKTTAGEPKYRSRDGSKTWTGNGKKPGWIVEELEKNGTADALLIRS